MQSSEQTGIHLILPAALDRNGSIDGPYFTDKETESQRGRRQSQDLNPVLSDSKPLYELPHPPCKPWSSWGSSRPELPDGTPYGDGDTLLRAAREGGHQPRVAVKRL